MLPVVIVVHFSTNQHEVSNVLTVTIIGAYVNMVSEMFYTEYNINFGDCILLCIQELCASLRCIC